jgi:hypothetical protein
MIPTIYLEETKWTINLIVSRRIKLKLKWVEINIMINSSVCMKHCQLMINRKIDLIRHQIVIKSRLSNLIKAINRFFK